MKRVMCLYRVSTKGQVDPQDDIPMQRRECLEFISRQQDWQFCEEVMEKGVSGYKVSIQKRDVIQDLKNRALRKEFDVLLVFMFDRLGRREDETPFLVQWFVEHGIEVWSTREGQQKIENRADKLINYIRYWQAGGESEKTSIRVKAAHSQMTSDGIWRGGIHPYGYKLVHNGRIGKKNRKLYDLEIDEKEGPIIQEIFRLCCYEGYGALRICNYLNCKYPDPAKVWSRPSIMTILRNPTYTGRMHMNDIQSAPIESLRLVSDEEFSYVAHALQSRILHRYSSSHEVENSLVPDDKTKTSVYGASLLSGIIYCAHCHHRLTGSYCRKQRNNGAYYRPIYRCYNGSIDGKHCDGQTVYSARKIEEIVLTIVRRYYSYIKSTVEETWKEQNLQQKSKDMDDQMKQIELELQKLKDQKTALSTEALKCITGESTFDTILLNTMLSENKKEMDKLEERQFALRKEKEREKEQLIFLGKQYRQISEWAEGFDHANLEQKKSILAHLIKQIDVDRNYHLVIQFFAPLQGFQSRFDYENAEIIPANQPGIH